MFDPDVVQASIGKRHESEAAEYGWRDVVLYALGIGAQADELPFIYENVPGGLQVFPSFAVTSIPAPWVVLPELDLEPYRTVHAGQRLRVYRPFATAGKLVNVSEVVSIYDKRKAAVITIIAETLDESGEVVCENEATYYYMGGGGFGGDRGPKSQRISPPDGVDPDFRTAYSIPENQAALYRLSGDYNPLHIDAERAREVGFDTPILHGLCTFGYAIRAILYATCDGDVKRFKEFRVRFSAPVFPGDTLTTEGWKERDDRYIIRVSTDRQVVMSHAYVELADGS